MEENVIDEIIAKIENLFEGKGYTLDDLKKAMNNAGELKIAVDKIKSEILEKKPEISHDELIEEASKEVTRIVEKNEQGKKTSGEKMEIGD